MSIDVNVQNDLVIVTESSEDITVNVSNAAGPAGVGVPTGGTTGQVLKKFTNTNYDTYWAADASGLTSIGLSMPNAFAVSNSPLTTNGTIAVTGAGTADQYVRGDGQLANFPTNQGGGSSVNYYLNGSVNQGTFGGDTYYEMSKSPIIGAGTNFTRTNAQGNGYIASFITDAGEPALLNIPGGNWNLEFYFQASSGGGNPSFYTELYKVSSANVFTLIATGSTNPEGITQGTVIDQYFTSIPVPQTALLATDRLAIRIFVTPSGRTITLHTENSNLCEVLTTFSTGLNALNGLTSQVQYFATGTSGTDFGISSATDTHTFNLPTASGTNRGALSSADWTTFSGKVGGSGASGQVAFWNGTNSQTGSANFVWDNAPGRLSILSGVDNLLNLTPSSSGNAIVVNSNGYIKWENASLDTYIRGSNGFFILNNGFNTQVAFPFGTMSYINTGQNFAIGGSTDGGQRLQVYGDAFVRGSGTTVATSGFVIQNSSSTDLLRVYNDGSIYLKNWTGGFGAAITGNSTNNLSIQQTIGLSGTHNATQFFCSFNNTSGISRHLSIEGDFNPTSGTGNHISVNIARTVNQTGGANGITRGLYINPTLTAAADWRSIEWSNNSGWGLYGAGTSANYLGGKIGLGTTDLGATATLRSSLQISGGTQRYNVLLDNVVQSGVTSFAKYCTTYVATQAATFTLVNLYHYTAEQGTLGTNSVVINQFGFFADSTLIGATNDYGFYGNIPNAANRWNLYMAGDADNYLRGKLLINTTSVGTFALDVNGTARVSGQITSAITADAFNRVMVSNTTSGTSSFVVFSATSDASSGEFQFGKYSTSKNSFAGINAKDGFIYNSTGGDIAISNAAATGTIKLFAGGSTTVYMTIKANGSVRYQPMATPGTADAGDVYYDSSTNKLRCYNGSTWNDLF